MTVDGITRALPQPFLLLATQNPVEYEGTYRLPEAQFDRFLMRLTLGYPMPEQEIEMLSRGQEPAVEIKPVLVPEEMRYMQLQVRSVLVDDRIKKYLVSVADASRRHRQLSLGISPRGTLAWMGAAQAMAYYKGRTYVIPDDVKAVAESVLAHRIVLKSEAVLSGVHAEQAVADLLNRAEVPLFSHVPAAGDPDEERLLDVVDFNNIRRLAGSPLWMEGRPIASFSAAAVSHRNYSRSGGSMVWT